MYTDVNEMMYQQKYLPFFPIELILPFIFNAQYLTHQMIEQCYLLYMNDDRIYLNLLCFEAFVWAPSIQKSRFFITVLDHAGIVSVPKQVTRTMWLFNISQRLDISRKRMSSYCLELPPWSFGFSCQEFHWKLRFKEVLHSLYRYILAVIKNILDLQ